MSIWVFVKLVVLAAIANVSAGFSGFWADLDNYARVTKIRLGGRIDDEYRAAQKKQLLQSSPPPDGDLN